MERARGGKGGLAARLVLTAATAALCILAVEYALRILPFRVIMSQYVVEEKDRSQVLHHHRGKGDEHAVVKEYGRCRGRDVRRTRLLALGDSWIQLGTVVDAMGRRLSESLGSGRCLEVVNAGGSSYSPSLYLLKARIVSAGRKPDFIVVNVDDTDLGDEWYRYRPCLLREDGVLIAVRPDPGWTALVRGLGGPWESWQTAWTGRGIRMFGAGFLDRKRPFSLVGMPWHMMSVLLSERPREDFPRACRYFEERVEEMLAGLVEIGGSADQVFLTHHPHYPSVSKEPGGIRYNTVVSELLAEASAAQGVSFVDALGQMEPIHGQGYERVFDWPSDPYSHL